MSAEDLDDAPPAPRYWLHLLLFVATFLTTTAQGAIAANGGALFPLASGLSYSIPLLAILTCHEFGHYFAARHHGVPASLPFFIPLPPPIGLLGTMGAVIFQSGTTDRKKLIDIGAAGPLAGLAVAIPVLAWGLAQSEVRAIPSGGMQEGNSLLYALLKFGLKGEWLPSEGRDVVLHPTAWAGWAGLLVTMLNLLPVDQLDGGHIATAYFGNRYRRISRFVHRGLLVLAIVVGLVLYQAAAADLSRAGLAAGEVSAWMIALEGATPWVTWFLMLGLLRRLARGGHPPVDDRLPLPPSRRALFWVAFATFVLIFMPVLLRTSIGRAPEPPTSALVTDDR